LLSLSLKDSPFQFTNWLRWRDAKALPGANRIIKHLTKNGVPMALASNSSTEYIYAKISHHKGIFLLATCLFFIDEFLFYVFLFQIERQINFLF